MSSRRIGLRMASSQDTVDFVLEQMADSGSILAKKMFGEYGIYCNDKRIGMVCDDQLFLKPTAAGRDFVGDVVEGSPYPGAKPHLQINGDLWDNREWMSQLARLTADALPPPAVRKPRRAKS